MAWSPDAIAAVEGHPNHVNSVVFDTVYWTSLADPTNPCAGVDDAERYDPQTNPGGARCTLADYMINVFGPRPESDWGEQERALGRGFAAIPLSDVGVQFGLLPLMNGEITTEQFVDLNAKVGGVDIDLNYTEERIDAPDEAMARAYRSGAINSGDHLNRGRDHRSARTRTRAPSTTPTAAGRSAPASSASTAPSRTRRSGSARCR